MVEALRPHRIAAANLPVRPGMGAGNDGGFLDSMPISRTQLLRRAARIFAGDPVGSHSLHHRLIIGGRNGDTTPRPSLRTGLADFPHPALQLALGSFSETGCFQSLGRFKAEEPKLGKVAVVPALVIFPTSASTPFPAFTHN